MAAKNNFLTDDEVEVEIQRLRESEACKLGKKMKDYRYARRNYMYTLRAMEREGIRLQKQGFTLENFSTMVEDMEAGDEAR